MNLCSKYHDEICFDARKCPVCEIIEDKNRQIDELVDKVRELQGEVNDLNEAAYPST